MNNYDTLLALGGVSDEEFERDFNRDDWEALCTEFSAGCTHTVYKNKTNGKILRARWTPYYGGAHRRSEYMVRNRRRIAVTDSLKAKATALWQELNEADISYDEYVEVSEHIVNLFATIK